MADVARSTPRWLKRYLGRLAYGVVGSILLLKDRPFQARLISQDRQTTVTTRQVFVANGRFQGARVIAPEAHVDDRQLLVVTLGEASRLRWLRRWFSFVVVKQRTPPKGEWFVTTAVTIDTTPRQYIDVDGETTTQTPARFSLAPEALMVMVPQHFEDRGDRGR